MQSDEALEGNLRKQTSQFDDPLLLQHLQINKANGLVTSGEQVYVYARLQFVPWVLVFSFDKALLSCTDCF